jgi:hypothetical protein
VVGTRQKQDFTESRGDLSDEGRTLDECDVGHPDNDSKVRSVADQFLHSAIDLRHQKAVFQGHALIFRSPANFLKGLLVQANDAADVLVQFSFHLVLVYHGPMEAPA